MKKDCPKSDSAPTDDTAEVSSETPAVNAIIRRVSHPEPAGVLPPPVLEAKQEGVASTPPPPSVGRVSRAVSAAQKIDLVPEGTVSSQLLRARGHLNHYPVTVLFDCGSTEDVVSERVVQRAKLETVAIDATVSGFSSGMSKLVTSMVPGALLTIQKYQFTRDFIVAPLVGADVILGVKWFRQYKPRIDWDTNVMLCECVGGYIDLLQDSSQVPIISTVQVVASQADPVNQGSSFPSTSTHLVASIVRVQVSECTDAHSMLCLTGKTRKRRRRRNRRRKQRHQNVNQKFSMNHKSWTRSEGHSPPVRPSLECPRQRSKQRSGRDYASLQAKQNPHVEPGQIFSKDPRLLMVSSATVPPLSTS